MKINLRDSKGITIIALIITIIVMIILATISIKYGFKSINSTQDSVIESGLETVQQALIQQYTKANTLEKNDKDVDFSNTSDKYYIGIPQTKEDIKALLEDHGVKDDDNKFNLLNFDYGENEYNSTKNDDIYYKLESSDLEKLGIDDAKGREYLVNYSTGEVWDLTNIKYDNGNYAYINGIGTELEISKEDFTDSPIKILLENDVQPHGPNTYIITLKVTDDFAKISQDEKNKDDQITIEDFKEGRIVVKIDNVEKKFSEINGKISILPTNVVKDDDKSIGEYYQYNIVIDKSIFPNEESSITFIIKEDTLKDEKNYTNIETELSASLNDMAKTKGTISFSLGNLQYFTKSEKYPNGYTDDQNRTWGTSAIVELTLECNTGLLNQDYVFSYAWDKGISDLRGKDGKVKTITLRPREGDKVVKGSIYLDSYTGEGTLTVGPVNNEYMGLYSSEIGYGVKTIPVNLDNQIPVGEIYVYNQSGKLDKLDAYSNTYFRLDKGFEDNVVMRGSSKLNPNMCIELSDNESGLASSFYDKEESSVGFYYSFSTEPKYNLIYSDDLAWNAGYTIGAREYTVKDDVYFITTWGNIPVKELTSGEFYINMGLRTVGTNIVMCDEVGNTDDNVIVKGPIKIDFFTPCINNIIFDNDNNAKITISDDYSGLSNDYSKIKYAWVKSKEETPTEWNTISEENIKPIQYNNDNNILKLQASIEFPNLTGEWYLCTTIDGYKDIAGNEANNKIIYSDNAVDGYADDLEIEISETEGLGYPKDVSIEVYSNSNKKFKISEMWFEHKGLKDRIELVNTELLCLNNYQTIINSTVNGPIIVHVKDSFGNEKEKEYTIKNVASTILEYKIDNLEKLVLPIKWAYNNIIYIDWGDGSGEFSNSVLPDHKYNNGNYTVKISGVLDGSWDYNLFSSKTCTEEEKDFIIKSRESLLGINNIGVHGDLSANSGIEKYAMDKYFYNCSNLKQLPKNIYKDAFSYVSSMNSTFYRNRNIGNTIKYFRFNKRSE